MSKVDRALRLVQEAGRVTALDFFKAMWPERDWEDKQASTSGGNFLANLWRDGFVEMELEVYGKYSNRRRVYYLTSKGTRFLENAGASTGGNRAD